MFPQLSIARHVRMAVKPLPQDPFVTVLTTVIVGAMPVAGSNAVGGSKFHACKQLTDLSAAHVITGAVVSRSVTVWAQLTLLLHPSATSQVRVAVKVGAQNPLVFVTVLTTFTVTPAPTQLSIPVGGSKFHACPYSIVLFGAHTGTGGVVSMTFTT
jgi:hypothetical protein